MGSKTQGKVAKVLSGALHGFDGALIEVEADSKVGLPGMQIVGMGNKAVDEARQRVRSAISNSLLDFPARKLTINLAPAELPKDGTHLDLPIALSVLVASGQLRQKEVDEAFFAGELALDGSVRPVRGAVLLAELAAAAGAKRLFLPTQNVRQAQLTSNLDVIGVSSLQGLYRGLKRMAPFDTAPVPPLTPVKPPASPTLENITGQEQAKRALVIAAAGRHNLLFSGSPGAGKTLLARALQSLLPELTPQETLEVTKLYSLASGDDGSIYTQPPFRAPHHSATLTALIGGGLKPRPGDISLAHKGVLFLDEILEFPRATLEALRQPLEDRVVHLSRLYGHITWPADVLLVGTLNPCPCGYLGDAKVQCTCTMGQIESYKKRLSGPLLDRIDLRLSVTKVDHKHFLTPNMLTNGQQIKVFKLIRIARNAQALRYKRSDIYNAHASLEDARTLFNLLPEAQQLLNTASTKLTLTSRGYLRTLRVARTIADLEQSESIRPEHISEALRYRT